MRGFRGQSVSKEHKEGQSKIDCQRGGGEGVIRRLQIRKGGEIK